MSLEGIAVLNIPSMHGGSNLWGETKKTDTKRLTSQAEPDVIVDPEILKVTSQGSLSLFLVTGAVMTHWLCGHTVMNIKLCSSLQLYDPFNFPELVLQLTNSH